MSDDGRREQGPLVFALNLLYAVGAPYEATEIAIVVAVVRRGFTRQPNSKDDACFLSDQYLAERTRVSQHTVKRCIARHCQRERPVLGRTWPGQTYGDDNRRHLHTSPRYTLLRTEDQIRIAKAAEGAHDKLERKRAAKRYRTKVERKIAAATATSNKKAATRRTRGTLTSWGDRSGVA